MSGNDVPAAKGGSLASTTVTAFDPLETGVRFQTVSPARRAVQRFLRHRPATISLALLAVLTLLAVGAPLVQHYPPDVIDLTNASAPPSLVHWLGTDEVGRDIWSRTIFAGRVSLSLGFVAALFAAVIGTILGCIAGFMKGWVDSIIMRFVDVLMTMPSILVLLVVVMYVGPGLEKLMIILPAMGWTGSCRLIRGQVLAVREMDFVTAARCLGYPVWRIMFLHVLPNAFAPILVSITLGVGEVILAESGLSFLGLGVQPPTASWGNMLAAATDINVLQHMPWMWLPPGLLIIITVLCVNFLGDGLRDAIDPRMVLD